MKYALFTFVMGLLAARSYAQDVPNSQNAASMSPNTQKQGELGSVPVNIFTGIPNISVPIYTYAGPSNGLSTSISIDYFAGGAHVAESPTSVGLGWSLSAGGLVSRTVRGMPDDEPMNGFLYSAALPTDFRSNGSKYYYDSVDAQQDVFQYSFNGRAGKFYIGKNRQVVCVPNSKIRILPVIGTGFDTLKIVSFRIIAEDGVKYDFNDAEYNVISTAGSDTALYHSGYSVTCIILPGI